MVEKAQKEKRKVLVTGSSGMLGCDLCAELSGRYRLFGIDLMSRPCSALSDENFYRQDITDKERTVSAISKISPYAVFHTAAMTDVDGCELDPERALRMNAEGTRNVALGCSKAGAALIFISTDYVFDGKKGSPYREEDPTGPLSSYGRSKLEGEKALKDILDNYFIARTSWLYGSNGKNFIGAILSRAGQQKVLKVVSDQAGSPTYTKDLSAALAALLEGFAQSDSGYGTYHISNSGSVSWCDYARAIIRIARLDTEVIAISTKEAGRPAPRPGNSVLDNSKFNKFSKYRLRGWEDALKEYLSGQIKGCG
ncbi:dTDP-4-dehydrorhamnose reductase [Candidatus Omnitrophota bacterium]